MSGVFVFCGARERPAETENPSRIAIPLYEKDRKEYKEEDL